MSFHSLVNTAHFCEAARDFEKNRKNGKPGYIHAPVGSRDYSQYWEEQEQRCLYGYSVGDLWIPGRMYFWLNFFPIYKVPDHIIEQAQRASKEGGKLLITTAEKEQSFPKFWEIHYEWWNLKHIAWYGGEFMGIESPGGKHMGCLKTRGAGFSYMEACDGAYNYNFIDGSKSYYFAGAEPFLIGDAIMDKVKEGLDWINMYCPYWKKNRQVKNTLMHQKASYYDEYGVEKGTKSEIIAQIVDKSSKTRGKRGRKASFEEGGSFPKLEDALEVCLGSMRDGSVYVGQVSVFGCVCAGTEVYKANGDTVLIENLKQEDGILGYDGTSISQEPIVWMQPPALKECVEVILESGHKLRCSIDHPILSTNKSLKARRRDSGLKRRKVKFTEAQHLKTGDMVAVIEEVPVFGTLSNQYAYTTGLMIGDGYYGGTMEVIIDNDCSRQAVEIEVGSNNVIHKRTHVKSTGDSITSYSLKGSIRQYFRGNGMLGQSKQTKRFPENWKQYNKESLATLLAGYFDADGNTRNIAGRGVSIIYSSIVKELLEDTKKALLKFGIHSNLVTELSKGGYTTQHTIYRLYINRAESVDRFRKFIPIRNPNKQVPEQNKRIAQMLRDAEFIKDEEYAHNKHLKPLTGAVLCKVLEVRSIGMQLIYNLNAGNTHTYLANNIITHNTGGEEGPGIQGLENIFNAPQAWDMLAFPNIWEDGFESTECGYFVPCWRANSWYMDEDGNVDMKSAIRADNFERAKKEKSKKPKDLDRRKAEYPHTPSEALQRMSGNGFNIAEIDAQIKRIQTDKAVQGMLRYGKLTRSDSSAAVEGVEFHIQPKSKARPIEDFPHKPGDDLTGCVTVVQRPYQDQKGRVPEGMYDISFDAYYKDESEDTTSLFSIKVWKVENRIDLSFVGVPVAWYAGRPKDSSDCIAILFMLCDMYNCKAQGEISGGGQAVVTYAKTHRLLHRLHHEPEMSHNKEIASKSAGNSYLMNMSTDRKKLGITYLEDWHVQPRRIMESGKMILNIHRIYDIAFLQELRKHNPEKGNFDRISDASIHMFMQKEHYVQVRQHRRKLRNFYKRKLFESSVTSGYTESY